MHDGYVIQPCSLWPVLGGNAVPVYIHMKWVRSLRLISLPVKYRVHLPSARGNAVIAPMNTARIDNESVKKRMVDNDRDVGSIEAWARCFQTR
jgi:hypothetical protein